MEHSTWAQWIKNKVKSWKDRQLKENERIQLFLWFIRE